MTKIQNSKQMIDKHLSNMAFFRAEQALRSDTAQQRCMFRLLDIEPPEAQRFICNLVLDIWNFSALAGKANRFQANQSKLALALPRINPGLH